MKLCLSTKMHLPTPHRRDRIKMKPIYIKGLKQRQSTPTLHDPEVYEISYESLVGVSKHLFFNLEYRAPIERMLVMDMWYIQ